MTVSRTVWLLTTVIAFVVLSVVGIGHVIRSLTPQACGTWTVGIENDGVQRTVPVTARTPGDAKLIAVGRLAPEC